MKNEKILDIINRVNEAKTFAVLSKSEISFVAKSCKSPLPDSRLVELWNKYFNPKEIESIVKPVNGTEFEKYELDLLLDNILGKTNYDYQELYEKMDGKHSIRAIQDKVVDLSKKLNKVGSDETNKMKWSRNKKFLESFEPEVITSILDVYSGRAQWWKNNAPDKCNVITNDINKDIENLDYYLPASHLLWKFCEEDERKMSIVDLDPYAYSQDIDIERAIKMAQHGIIFTFGDRRALKNAIYRLYCGESIINTSLERYHTEKYSVDNVKKFIEGVAKKLGKKLVEFDQYSTGSIWRVYYKIEPADPDVLCMLADKKAKEVRILRETAAEILREKANELDKLAHENI